MGALCAYHYKLLKSQLLEFIEELEKPFTTNLLVKSCNQPISRNTIEEILIELEQEGHVIFIGNGEWISSKLIMERALKTPQPIKLPSNLIGELITLLIKKPELGYTNLTKFITDAIKHFTQTNPIKN